MLDESIKLSLNYYTPAALVEFAARWSHLSHYLQTGESYKDFCAKLEKMGHNSPKTCSLIVFTADNVDRAVTHQLVVHSKNIDKSQESQRYVNQGTSTFFKHPDIDHEKMYDIGPTEFDNRLTYLNVEEFYDLSIRLYNELIADGVKREVARRVLPNAVSQSICMWGSIADWQRVCIARMNPEAEKPIRSLFCAIFEVLRDIYPSMFDHDKYNKVYEVNQGKKLVPVIKQYTPIEDYNKYVHYKSVEKASKIVKIGE